MDMTIILHTYMYMHMKTMLKDFQILMTLLLRCLTSSKELKSPKRLVIITFWLRHIGRMSSWHRHTDIIILRIISMKKLKIYVLNTMTRRNLPTIITEWDIIAALWRSIRRQTSITTTPYGCLCRVTIWKKSTKLYTISPSTAFLPEILRRQTAFSS